jgi:hypothetical protein
MTRISRADVAVALAVLLLLAFAVWQAGAGTTRHERAGERQCTIPGHACVAR